MAGIFPACGRSGNPLFEGPGHLASRRGVPAEERVITSSWYPACDVFETAVKIVAERPGVKPEDVKLTLENKTP